MDTDAYERFVPPGGVYSAGVGVIVEHAHTAVSFAFVEANIHRRVEREEHAVVVDDFAHVNPLCSISLRDHHSCDVSWFDLRHRFYLLVCDFFTIAAVTVTVTVAFAASTVTVAVAVAAAAEAVAAAVTVTEAVAASVTVTETVAVTEAVAVDVAEAVAVAVDGHGQRRPWRHAVASQVVSCHGGVCDLAGGPKVVVIDEGAELSESSASSSCCWHFFVLVDNLAR